MDVGATMKARIRESVENAYSKLCDATAKWHKAALAESKAKQDYAKAHLRLFVDGKIIGKNAEERELSAQAQLTHEDNAVFQAVFAQKLAKAELELAQLKLSELEVLLAHGFLDD